MNHKINQTIINNRFLIHSPLGEGGFGKVMLVHDQEINEVCALKLIRPELASNDEVHKKFVKEAKIWMELEKHPNVVNVRAVDFFNERLFIVLEFIPPNDNGLNSLDAHLKNSHITLSDAIKWGIELCNGMVHAISRGLIAHRDLKPANLLIDPNDILKITDFGLAVFPMDPSKQLLDEVPAGTPIYMAPELFEETSIPDQCSDIYSFGIILHQMISGGQLPFKVQSSTPKNIFSYFKKLHQSYVLKSIDSPLFPIVSRCLEKKPVNRYQSFDEIQKELLGLYKSITGTAYQGLTTEEFNASEHNNYAVSFFLLGKTNRALEHIEKALTIAPNYPPSLNNKAGILAQMGRMDEAEELWQEIIKITPELGRPYYNLGNISMQRGDFDSAISFYEQALENEPTYIQAIVNMAICNQQLNKVESAIEIYDRAIEISPTNSQIIYNKAVLLHKVGDYDEAIALFSKVINLSPRHVSAYNYLGLCYQKQNRIEDALRCFNKAIQLDPSYKYALQNKRILLSQTKKKKGFFQRLFGGKNK